MLQMSGERARFCLLSAGRSETILWLPQDIGERYYRPIVQQVDKGSGGSEGRAAVL